MPIDIKFLRIAARCLLAIVAATASAAPASAQAQSCKQMRAQHWSQIAVGPVGTPRSHPLIGTILANGTPIDDSGETCKSRPEAVLANALAATVRSGGFVLLGEVHDNPTHHRLRAMLIKQQIMNADELDLRAAAVFEHLRVDQQAGIDAFYDRRGRSRALLMSSELLTEVGWDTSGWPDAHMFVPLFDAPLWAKMTIRPGDPPREAIKAVARQGASALPAAEVERLGLAAPFPGELQDGLLSELEASHCGLMPKSAFGNMAFAQRYRDAHLADAMISSAATYGAAILLAGNGHVRSDRGVPYYLRQRAPSKERLVVLLIEVEDGKDLAGTYDWRDGDGKPLADYIVFTPRAERKDPCAKMRERSEKRTPPASTSR